MKIISAFVFATLIVQFLIFLNFKPLSIFCGYTAIFVSGLVGNPEDRFLRDAARIILKVDVLIILSSASLYTALVGFAVILII